jgi:hypothetical protein
MFCRNCIAGEYDLPLVRHQLEVYESVQGIHFLMRDANTRQQVACVITREALAHRAASYHPQLNAIQVFDTHRDEIERAASDRWDRGEMDKRGLIYVSSVQFPPRPPTTAG